MGNSLFVSLLMNVSLLICVGSMMVEFQPARAFLWNRRDSLSYSLVLALVFGLLACAATVCGLPYQGAIVNTRVVSVGAAGILGGPIAGIGAGLIGGLHRYFYDPESFTSLACGAGTFCFGLVGAAFRPLYRLRRINRQLLLVLVVVVGEGIQVLLLFLMAHPLSAVVALEKAIFLPKLLMNSFGIVLFFAVFERMSQSHMDQLIEYQARALYVADRCLPHLRRGLGDPAAWQTVVDTVAENVVGYRVVLTDCTKILAISGGGQTGNELPDYAARALERGETCTVRDKEMVTVLLTMGDKTVGTMSLIVEPGLSRFAAADVRFAEALGKLFSTILELHNLDREIELRHQAEFRAFQAQINPHFFYNALNTISALCRTKPDEARRLLVALANYYRHTLSTNETFVTLEQELQNVENYLIITIARFEDTMHVECELPEDLESLRLPALVLQPLVENAVRHGMSEGNRRHVGLVIRRDGERMHFEVRDKGRGIPPEIMAELNNPATKKYSGLFNVAKRLRSIYGEEGALHAVNTPEGSCVSFTLPLTPPELPR